MKIRIGLSMFGGSNNPWSNRISTAKLLLDRQKSGLEHSPVITNVEGLCHGNLSFLSGSKLGLRSVGTGYTGARVNKLRGSSEKVMLIEDMI